MLSTLSNLTCQFPPHDTKPPFVHSFIHSFVLLLCLTHSLSKPLSIPHIRTRSPTVLIINICNDCRRLCPLQRPYMTDSKSVNERLGC
ncbi:hypothetical protein F5B20DRAFT_297367 [Whalleya microplaca]|nr:hypothetical protein F5B20DRAFT_297367 [Whalleya microplaca]